MGIKIKNLGAITTPQLSDVLVVETDGGTKKISVGDLLTGYESYFEKVEGDFTKVLKELTELQTWKSEVLSGATTVVIEDESATSTVSDTEASTVSVDESVGDGLSTPIIENPTMGDGYNTEAKDSEILSETMSESNSTTDSLSQSDIVSASESISSSESQSESESTSTSESEVEVEEVTSESIVVEPQMKEELA